MLTVFYANRRVRQVALHLLACSCLFIVTSAAAQELAPRAYWPAPVGTNVGILAYQRNTGDVVIDPSLPITGVESEINYFQAGYQRYFRLFGRTSAVQLSLPYADGDAKGIVDDQFRGRQTAGMIVPLHPTWLFEVEVGAWFFGDNDDFLGETRKQDPILLTEIHLIKRIRPGFWASLDANYYTGGETRVGDAFSDDLQRNSRAGMTLVFPFQRRHAVRAAYSTGLSTRSGGDFEMFSLSWTWVW